MGSLALTGLPCVGQASMAQRSLCHLDPFRGFWPVEKAYSLRANASRRLFHSKGEGPALGIADLFLHLLLFFVHQLLFVLRAMTLRMPRMCVFCQIPICAHAREKFGRRRARLCVCVCPPLYSRTSRNYAANKKYERFQRHLGSKTKKAFCLKMLLTTEH